jgi:hypothetical protein
MSAPGWHVDPSGRHQHRWWDGAAWSDQVADNGVAGVDPLNATPPAGSPSALVGAVSPHAETILGRSRLFFESGGGMQRGAGWWAVTDEHRQPVARVWRDGRHATFCDDGGLPVLGASAILIGRGQDRSVSTLSVGAGGRQLATVSYVRAKNVTFRFKSGNERVLTMKLDLSGLMAKIEGAALFDGAKHQVATITEHDRERGGTTTHSWLLLDRDPQLAEPERSLVMASPLVLNCFLYSLGMDRQFS